MARNMNADPIASPEWDKAWEDPIPRSGEYNPDGIAILARQVVIGAIDTQEEGEN